MLGVVPYLRVEIEDEDSLSDRLEAKSTVKPLDIAILRLPHVSNFTDFIPLEQHPLLGVRYVQRTRQLGAPDLVVLPGTKNTMDDLRWLRESGLEAAVLRLSAAGTPVLGVCGGYQMLGTALDDPDGVEQGGRMDGMGLLPCATRFTGQKVRTRVQACAAAGPFAGAQLDGYEIHMGVTRKRDGQEEQAAMSQIKDQVSGRRSMDGYSRGNVYGSYIHGIFDREGVAEEIAESLAKKERRKA